MVGECAVSPHGHRYRAQEGGRQPCVCPKRGLAGNINYCMYFCDMADLNCKIRFLICCILVNCGCCFRLVHMKSVLCSFIYCMYLCFLSFISCNLSSVYNNDESWCHAWYGLAHSLPELLALIWLLAIPLCWDRCNNPQNVLYFVGGVVF